MLQYHGQLRRSPFPHCYWNLILELPETGEFQSSRVSLRIVLPWKTAQRDAWNKPGMIPSCPSNKPGLMSDRSALWESQGREVRVLILPSRSMINKHPPGVNSDLSAKRWWHLYFSWSHSQCNSWSLYSYVSTKDAHWMVISLDLSCSYTGLTTLVWNDKCDSLY